MSTPQHRASIKGVDVLKQNHYLFRKTRNSFKRDKAWNLLDEVNKGFLDEENGERTSRLRTNTKIETEKKKKKKKKITNIESDMSPKRKKRKGKRRKELSSIKEKKKKKDQKTPRNSDENGPAKSPVRQITRKTSSAAPPVPDLTLVTSNPKKAETSPLEPSSPTSPVKVGGYLPPSSNEIARRQVRSARAVSTNVTRMGVITRRPSPLVPNFSMDCDDSSDETENEYEFTPKNSIGLLMRSRSDPSLLHSWDYVPFHNPPVKSTKQVATPGKQLSTSSTVFKKRTRSKPPPVANLKESITKNLSEFQTVPSQAIGTHEKIKSTVDNDKKLINYKTLTSNGNSPKQVLESANLSGLISILLSDESAGEDEYDFSSKFFVAYHWFTSADVIMTNLYLRFNAHKVPYRKTELKEKFVILKTLKKWVGWHVEDFVTDEKMRTQLSLFLQRVQQIQVEYQTSAQNVSGSSEAINKFEKWMKSIYQLLLAEKHRETQEKARLERVKSEMASNSQLNNRISGYFVLGEPISLSLLRIPPRELAQQITLRDYEMFQKVTPQELVHNIWMKDTAETLSPNVLDLINRFNQMCYWVATKIVSTANLKKRAAVLSRFIQIARYLREFNNFHGLMTFYSALNFAAVQRMKSTWKALGSKPSNTLKELDELFLPIGNYKNYFTALNQTYGPCVPILSILLGRLTSLEEVMDDFVGGKGSTLVNCRKLNQIGKMLLDYIYRFRDEEYKFTRVEEIVVYVENRLNVDIFSDKELYEMSRKIEPSRELLREKGTSSMNTLTKPSRLFASFRGK